MRDARTPPLGAQRAPAAWRSPGPAAAPRPPAQNFHTTIHETAAARGTRRSRIRLRRLQLPVHLLGALLLALLPTTSRVDAFKVYKAWTDQHWCDSVYDPHWPFAYAKREKGGDYELSLSALTGAGMFVGTVVAGVVIVLAGGVRARGALVRDVCMYACTASAA